MGRCTTGRIKFAYLGLGALPHYLGHEGKSKIGGNVVRGEPESLDAEVVVDPGVGATRAWSTKSGTAHGRRHGEQLSICHSRVVGLLLSGNREQIPFAHEHA